MQTSVVRCIVSDKLLEANEIRDTTVAWRNECIGYYNVIHMIERVTITCYLVAGASALVSGLAEACVVFDGAGSGKK